MEIVFLNTYDGKLRAPISEFISYRTGITDIFCFQEVYEGPGRMRELAGKLLPEYKGIFAYKAIQGDDFPQASFFGPQINILKTAVLFPDEQDFGLGIFSEIEHNGSRLSILNFHGRSRPGDKLDTAERLGQSEKIIEYFQSIFGPKIIGGDFNIDLDTQSIRMFAEAGYRNLIIDYKIKTTRNRIIWEKYPTTPQYYSDYIFVSPEVLVTNLEVPENEISDHLPIILHVE